MLIVLQIQKNLKALVNTAVPILIRSIITPTVDVRKLRHQVVLNNISDYTAKSAAKVGSEHISGSKV